MSTTITTGHSLGETHAEHHEPGLIGRYIFSRDHKAIGIQFLFTALIFMALGGLLALAVRWRIAWPATDVPIVGKVDGAMYATLFTMHATVMIFFVIIPLLVGAFGNFVVPLHIGARDMAFPFLNGLSYWIMPLAGIIMLYGFWLEGGAAAGGWTSYPPLSVIAPNGQTCWCISLIIVGSSSIMGAVNYITTIIKMRAPGLTFHRMSLTVWSVFITSILVLFGTPVLTSALILLILDRHAGTTFFTHDGQPLLFQHLFWFYSHPAVYIMILPAMGIVSDVISVFSRKPIFGYRAMAYSMVGISGLGYIVWGHHMFQSGMNPKLGTTFMMSTMLIALPSAVKTFNWLGTLWGGNIRFTTPMLNALAFVSMFVIGGLSGIFMAATPVDIQIHDTYFIVAHIHYVLFGGTLFGVFAGITFWFPKMFGKMMNETVGKIHFILTFIAFNCTFFPMHIVGAAGLPRRYADYVATGSSTQWAHLQPYNEFMTISALVLGTAQVLFFGNFLWSLWKGKKAPQNPWLANTMEWTLPSPPVHGNYFPSIPEVHRGPYEYTSPIVSEDYLPQSRALDPEASARERLLQAEGH